MIIKIIILVIAVASSIIFHEAGHLAAIRYYGRRAYVEYREHDLVAEMPEGLTTEEEKVVVQSGIIAGIIPLMIFSYFAGLYILFIGGLLYFAGLGHDYKYFRGK